MTAAARTLSLALSGVLALTAAAAAKSAAPAKTAKPAKTAARAKAPAAAKTPKPPKIYLPADSATARSRSGFSPVPGTGGTRLVSGRSVVQLVPRKAQCVLDGIKLALCFPAHQSDGRMFLHPIDLRKSLAPLSPRRTDVFRHRVLVITIDPGHGGRDRGAAGRTLHEKAATLMISRRVAAILRVCGYRVNLTRGSDYYVPLGERCRIQRQHRSDIFVSIHINAAANRGFHGIETYALTPAGAASTSGGPPSNKSFRGNIFDANNLLLAYTVQRTLLRRTGAFDRGVKRARFAVLRDIAAPGVLVEVGYVSNPREERLLLDPAYREKIARGIAEGIIVYHRAMTQR